MIANKIAWRVPLLVCLIVLGGCRGRQFTRPTPQMNIEPQFWVRVLLLDDITGCTLKTVSPFSVINVQTQATEARFEKLDAPINIRTASGRIAIDGHLITGEEAIILPDDPHIFNINGDDYRGKLQFIINPDGHSFDVVNLVPLEPYLASVVGAEMPNYWEPAALQAQAIAARTYCLYIKRHFGTKRKWDVRKTQANQVYLGIASESIQTWNAVYRTYGEILVCKHPDGNEDIFPAYYSSTCGGHTENSEHVFGDSFEPLVGVACPYCKDEPRDTFRGRQWP